MADRKNEQPEWVAFPGDGFVALSIPRALIPPLPPEATGHLIRVKSAEGFRRFLSAAMDAARLTWPEIAAEWDHVNVDDRPPVPAPKRRGPR